MGLCRLISISIDICDSTRIKQIIKAHSTQDEENRVAMYEQMLKRIYNIEFDLYPELVRNGIDIKQIFSVKGIGDEVWGVIDAGDIELNTYEFNERFLSVINALKTVRENCLAVPNRKLSWEEECEPRKIKDDVTFKYSDIESKITVDLIEEAIDCNPIRYEQFIKRFQEICGKLKPITPEQFYNEYPEYAERLNIGTVEEIHGENKLKTKHRTDLFGPDADRFFRITKYAKSGYIVLGKSIYKALYEIKETALRCNKIEIDVRTKKTKMISSNQFTVKKKYLKPGKLKGISEPYEVYYLPMNNLR